MEEKKDAETLIVSYLLHELNAEDEAYITKAIHASPALQQDVENLRKLLRLLDIERDTNAIDLSKERARLEAMWNMRHPVVVDTASYALEAVEKPSLFRLRLKALAVAACLVAVGGTAWMFFHRSSPKQEAITKQQPADSLKQQAFTRYETNVSGQPRHFQLQDGTEVVLWDQSVISYTAGFNSSKRDIQLKGKAAFKVAKDKSRPFTVYSDGISTTAVGTEFTVTSYEKENNIVVRLEEGKVMVQSQDAVKRKMVGSFYLVPGQEFVYNKQQLTALVRKYKIDPVKDSYAAGAQVTNDNPSLPDNSGGAWFMFNNQSLPQILDQLKLIYNIDIKYSRKELEKLYFIGRFDKKDSVEYILKSIASLNNLTLSKQNNTYIIRK